MKTYLIHIQLQTRSKNELATFSEAMEKIFSKHATAHLLASKAAADNKFLFVYLASSEKPAHILRKAIDGNLSDDIGKTTVFERTGFKNGDSLFVAELGSEISENGFNVMAAWLNRQNRKGS